MYDGWETRRRRVDGADWASIRLGAPGIVRGVVVDTAFFAGNYPPEVSVVGRLSADGRAALRRRWLASLPEEQVRPAQR